MGSSINLVLSSITMSSIPSLYLPNIGSVAGEYLWYSLVSLSGNKTQSFPDVIDILLIPQY
jgi:hypothetical protein